MAARKPKPKPRGASRTASAPARKPVPGWIWLASGAVLGGFLVFLAQLEPGRDEVKRATEGQPATTAKPATPPPPQRPRYEFYEELARPTPGQPSAEQIEAAEAARAQALLEGRTPPPRLTPAPASPAPATAPPSAAPSQPLATPTAPAVAPPAATSQPATTASTPAPATRPAPPPAPAAKPPAPAPAGARFYLQAGAFSSAAQAESARARLLLLGQDARIESGQANGRTVHRVVVGPFGSRQQADGAQKQLGANGVNSVVQQRR